MRHGQAGGQIQRVSQSHAACMLHRPVLSTGADLLGGRCAGIDAVPAIEQLVQGPPGQLRSLVLAVPDKVQHLHHPLDQPYKHATNDVSAREQIMKRFPGPFCSLVLAVLYEVQQAGRQAGR